MHKKLTNIIFPLFLFSSYLVACTGNCYEPEAIIEPGPTYYQGIEIVLDGSSSYDPDGVDSLTFQWILPAGLTPTDSIFTNSNLRFNAFRIDDFIDVDCSNSEYQTLEDCVDNGFIWTDSDGIQDFPYSNFYKDENNAF